MRTHLLGFTLGTALFAAASTSFAAETAGAIDFGKFTPPAGGEFVEVKVNGNLLAMAAKLAEKTEPEAAQILKGLKSIRVNVVGLDDANRAEIEQRIKNVRADLEAQGWERAVTVQKPGEDVGIYIKTQGDEAVEGLVVTVLQAKGEAVLVNIVGNIRPEQLTAVAERLNIEPLKDIARR
ncbi:MAG: DUF4252 domain-containing protein [Limisphaerales bacterium]